jgi:RimJ/RimL family protein N-acetyltransferase
MRLVPLDGAERFALVTGWLGRKENHRWLDFGDGRQLVSPEWLKVAMQRGTLVLRLFTRDEDDQPIGLVGLSNVSRAFKTANFFVVLGDKAAAGRGYASRAGRAMLTLAFRELGLEAVHTWIVEGNHSVHVARNMGFKPFGRQRRCHVIDGQPYDRLWYDVLAAEHEEVHDAEPRPRTA